MTKGKIILWAVISTLVLQILVKAEDKAEVVRTRRIVPNKHPRLESWKSARVERNSGGTDPLRSVEDKTQNVNDGWNVGTPRLKGSASDEDKPNTGGTDRSEDDPSTGKNTTNNSGSGLCPVMEGSSNSTIFYDLILSMTQNEIDLTNEASFSLRTEMHRYINAYGSCVCPTSGVEFKEVYRLGTSAISEASLLQRSIMRRNLRRLVSKGRNKMAAPGIYRPPTNVDLGKIISESINKQIVGSNNVKLSTRRFHRSLTDNTNCDYVSRSFAERLNATKEFKGTILEASVEESAMSSCAQNADTCCNHISYDATCDNNYNSASLCQMTCCCNFPEASCCRTLFENKKCDYYSFCAGTMSGSTFPPTTMKKVSVYFPAVDVGMSGPNVD